MRRGNPDSDFVHRLPKGKRPGALHGGYARGQRHGAVLKGSSWELCTRAEVGRYAEGDCTDSKKGRTGMEIWKLRGMGGVRESKGWMARGVGG